MLQQIVVGNCMARKKGDCRTMITICLTSDNNDSVEVFQRFVKNREKKSGFNKDQTINRIIKEWAEDRHLILEVAKKQAS